MVQTRLEEERQTLMARNENQLIELTNRVHANGPLETIIRVANEDRQNANSAPSFVPIPNWEFATFGTMSAFYALLFGFGWHASVTTSCAETPNDLGDFRGWLQLSAILSELMIFFLLGLLFRRLESAQPFVILASLFFMAHNIVLVLGCIIFSVSMNSQDCGQSYLYWAGIVYLCLECTLTWGTPLFLLMNR